MTTPFDRFLRMIQPPRPSAPNPAPSAALLAGCLAILCAATSAFGVPARAGERDSGTTDWLMNGTWRAGRDTDEKDLWMSFRVSSGHGSSSEHGGRVAAGEIEGLDLGAIGGSRTSVEFRVKRDAGAIRCHGVFADDRGSGLFDLELDPHFADELARRGVGRPSRANQARLLLAGAGYPVLDALAREKYETPDVEMLVRMANHGVNEKFVKELSGSGYRLPGLDALVTACDHGVNPEFIRRMADAGYRNVDFDVLLQARDHGADPDFVADVAEAGFRQVPLELLIRVRDHGVDGGYIDALRRAGFQHLSLEEAIRARDHGVTGGYARRVRDRYPSASLDEVISYRDRGERP